MNDLNNFKVSRNFKLKEFQSPDTKEVKISARLIKKIQRVRTLRGRAIVVTSGYRTKRHNRKVKGNRNSQHMRGLAVDISTVGHVPQFLKNYAKSAGFKEVIIYPKNEFLHCGLEDR